MAYLTATVESMMKQGHRKEMKTKKGKHNRACDLPSSSNFDSDLEAGCHKHVVDKHLKLDEPFFSDFKTTQPRPIKVADQIPIGSTRADEKALENAKIGKVIIVVALTG